jgi:hypothetical protein
MPIALNLAKRGSKSFPSGLEEKGKILFKFEIGLVSMLDNK